MPHSSKPKDARELAARALCEFEGVPEDTMYDGNPMWMSYLEQVDVVLEAAASAPAGSQLEYVPVRVYHVLRKLSQGAIGLGTMHGVEGQSLANFLVSRGLAVEVDGALKITVAGKAIGEIEDER